MSVQYFKSLLFRSAQLQREIEMEHQRRWPDWMRLLKLKKLRLAIWDRLDRFVYQGMNAELKPIRVEARQRSRSQWHHA